MKARYRAWDWWIDGFFCGYTRCIFALFSDGLHDSLDCGDGRADEIRCKVIMTSVYAQMCAHESEVQCCCRCDYTDPANSHEISISMKNTDS